MDEPHTAQHNTDHATQVDHERERSSTRVDTASQPPFGCFPRAPNKRGGYQKSRANLRAESSRTDNTGGVITRFAGVGEHARTPSPRAMHTSRDTARGLYIYTTKYRMIASGEVQPQHGSPLQDHPPTSIDLSSVGRSHGPVVTFHASTHTSLIHIDTSTTPTYSLCKYEERWRIAKRKKETRGYHNLGTADHLSPKPRRDVQKRP